MPVNVRDFQIVRESVVSNTQSARDLQLIREAVVSNSPKVREYQIFRESVIVLGAINQPVLFAVT